VALLRLSVNALILVAEHGGPTMFARIGVMRALFSIGPEPALFGLTGVADLGQAHGRGRAINALSLRLPSHRLIAGQCV
jgi:hypothetical protein